GPNGTPKTGNPDYADRSTRFTPRWHEENDLTEYSALLTKPQAGKVHLDNDAYQRHVLPGARHHH
ncbi:MAG: hypothetical protein KIT69_03370, partial [Propionibacteriaceae bacterium]|nr:hypothetical protein [Propionibacteriaceae bacterium]